MANVTVGALVKAGWSKEMARDTVAREKFVRKFWKEHPDLPVITAHIMANDFYSAEQWAKRIGQPRGNGEVYTPEYVANLVGSYARLDFALRHCPYEYVLDNIADLWRGSDPDDTDPRYVEVWSDAFFHHGERYVRDGKALPRNNPLTVYRGQMASDPIGMAWTLDIEIAKKFAAGAGIRTKMEGSVLQGQVYRGLVFGYLTGRGESEVVVRPSDVMGIQEVGYFGEKRDEE